MEKSTLSEGGLGQRTIFKSPEPAVPEVWPSLGFPAYWPKLVWDEFLSLATKRPDLSGLPATAGGTWPWKGSIEEQNSYPLSATTNSSASGLASFQVPPVGQFSRNSSPNLHFTVLPTYTSGQSCSRASSSSEQAGCILQREQRGHLTPLLGKEETSAAESSRVVSPKNSKQQMETLSIMKSFDQ